MGFRFRKIVKVLPGVRLNVSKRGPSSLSFGKKGFTVNLNEKGARTTISKPGTGLSYSTYNKHSNSNTKESGLPWAKILMWLLLGAVVALIATTFFK